MKQLLAVLYIIPYFLFLATDSFAKGRTGTGLLHVDASNELNIAYILINIVIAIGVFYLLYMMIMLMRNKSNQ